MHLSLNCIMIILVKHGNYFSSFIYYVSKSNLSRTEFSFPSLIYESIAGKFNNSYQINALFVFIYVYTLYLYNKGDPIKTQSTF